MKRLFPMLLLVLIHQISWADVLYTNPFDYTFWTACTGEVHCTGELQVIAEFQPDGAFTLSHIYKGAKCTGGSYEYRFPVTVHFRGVNGVPSDQVLNWMLVGKGNAPKLIWHLVLRYDGDDVVVVNEHVSCR